MTEQNDGSNGDDLTEKTLFIFFPALDQFEFGFEKFKELNKLIIIGQNVESLEGVEELRNLEELWVVECNLQQEHVEPIGRCCGLRCLYLYDNQLTAIPNLNALTKLSHLWLANNQIESFKGINNLLNVKELCLSNNNISTVDVKLKSTLKIAFLNLAGNPIKSLKEVQKLEALRRLRWLVLSDPLYPRSPVAQLANLRLMVIRCLPSLEKLDMLHISPAERAQAAKSFDSKLEYYRSTLHISLAKLCDFHKNVIDLEMKELEIIWDSLRNHRPSREKDDDIKSNSLRFWEDEGQRWKERLKILQLKFLKLNQVITEIVNLEVESCGNLQFMEVDMTGGHLWDELKNKLCSFVCSHLSRHVLDINIQNIWSIQGHYQTSVLQMEFKNGMGQFFIVTPVADLSILPLKFVENVLFGHVSAGDVVLSRCLALADPLVADDTSLHRQLLLRSQTLLASRLMVVCGVTDPSQLTVQENNFHGCDQFLPSDTSVLVPLYIVHYHYIFQDYFKPLKMVSVEEKQISMPHSIDTTKLLQNVSVLKLMASNLHKLEFPVMDHVTTVDLSYNIIEDINSVGTIFPRLTNLNVSFNRIHTLFNLQGLQSIVNLSLSWNFLTEFLSSIRSLKGLSSLRHLDLGYNPFRDVTCDLHQQFFVCKHLKSLVTYNDYPLSRSLLRGEVTLQGQDKFPVVPVGRQHKSTLSLQWKAELSDTESDNYLGVINNQVNSIKLRGLKLTQFRSVFSLSKLKWLDLQDNIFSGSSSLKASAALEEVNLSHNVIEVFSCANEKFKHLVKLNLSHNYISSLISLSCQAFPQLKLLDLSSNKLQSLTGLAGLKSLTELYLSHNELGDPNTIANLKDMKELRVLDMSFNPLAQQDSFRTVCLYNVNTLKFLNGCKVRLSETKSAIMLYDGVLDQDYLLRAHKNAPIDSLTQLSLPNCCIKKIDPNFSLPNLTSLTLDHNKISSLSWVQLFPNLARLSLSHNRVSRFGDDGSSALHQPPSSSSLEFLILDNNHIKNLTPLKLELFPNLRCLVLNNNEISSLSGLKNNNQLEHLMLYKNKLSVISCEQTTQLVNLRELYLERNSLTKLDFVRPLKKLRKLFIGHNKIVARSALVSLTDLPDLVELTIHGNPIFRSSKSYMECLPRLPSLQLLEGHLVNKSN